MISSKRLHYRFKLQPRNHVGWEITRLPPLHHLRLSTTFRPTRRCIFYYESNTILQIKFQRRTKMKFFYFLLSSHVSRGYRDSPLLSSFLSSFIKESRPFFQGNEDYSTRISKVRFLFSIRVWIWVSDFPSLEQNLRRFREKQLLPIFQYLLNWTIKEMAVIRSIDRARFQIVPTSVYILSISRCHFQFRFTPTAWSTLRSIHEEHC